MSSRRRGIIAIAPDLLSGKGANGGGTKTMDSNAVGQALRDLPPDQITADFNAAGGLCAEAAVIEREAVRLGNSATVDRRASAMRPIVRT